ncbi:MAG: AI-2E family transporter [Verrucomicrobia bacterium]|nr:AI-2E family transporter [Verrucomicrobiota bacterium]
MNPTIDQVPRRVSYFRRLVTVALTLVIVISTFYVLSIGEQFFVPLVMAVLAVYLVDILSRFIRKFSLGGYSIPAAISIMLAFAIIFGLGFVLVEIIAQNARHVAAAAPKYQARLQQLQAEIFLKFGIEEPPELRQLLRTIDLPTFFGAVAKEVATVLEDVTLIVIYGVFMMLERRFIPVKVEALFPDPERRKNAIRIIRRIDRDIHTYLGVKTAVSLTSALLAYVLMRTIGLDFAEFWALLVFLLHFIPTIGIIVATLLPTLLAAVQFDSLGPVLVVGIGITAIAQLMGNIVEPNVMGETLNLSPLTVIISLIVWGSVWGIVGAFLCVPLTVILVIVLSNFKSTRWVSILLSKTGEIRSYD